MANDTTVTRYLPDGRGYENIDTAKTLTAADSGIVQNVIADAITITLPSTALGLQFTVRNGGVPKTSGPVGTGSNGTVLVTVAPAAADGVTGNNFAAATNKGASNTKATARVGDEIRLLGTGTAGVTAWNIAYVSGIWIRVP